MGNFCWAKLLTKAVTMSADLQWMLLKNNSSFLVKKNGTTFTSEPNNLMNLNTYKFSGLANKKTVGVAVKDGKIEVSLKKTKGDAARRPASSFARSQLNSHMSNKTCKAAESLTKLTSGQHYRSDLTKFAVARYHALYRSLKVDPSADKKQQRKRRGKN